MRSWRAESQGGKPSRHTFTAIVALVLINGNFSHNITEDKAFLMLLGTRLALAGLKPPAREVPA